MLRWTFDDGEDDDDDDDNGDDDDDDDKDNDEEQPDCGPTKVESDCLCSGEYFENYDDGYDDDDGDADGKDKDNCGSGKYHVNNYNNDEGSPNYEVPMKR